MDVGLPVTVEVPTESVAAAADQDLPGRCWRHDSPAVRIQSVTLDNFQHTSLRAFDNVRSIRWQVCAVCMTERRRALRRAMLASLGSLAVAALLLTWLGFTGSSALGSLGWIAWPLAVVAVGVIAYVFIYDARWANIVGVAPSDARFSRLTFIVATGVTDEIRAWLDPTGGI